MTRYEVVRQTSGGKQTLSTHRYEWVAYLHRRWQDFLQRRRSRRSVEVGVREIGVHYNVLPVEPAPADCPCCADPDCATVPDDVTETDQTEALS